MAMSKEWRKPVAAGTAFNQIVYTNASENDVDRHFSNVQATGWQGPARRPPNSLVWSRTLWYGRQESLVVTIIDEGRWRKVIVAGDANPDLSSALRSALTVLPTEGPAPEKQGGRGTDSAEWFARLILIVILVVGGLWLLNNTQDGLDFKCHVLGDWGACLLRG